MNVLPAAATAAVAVRTRWSTVPPAHRTGVQQRRLLLLVLLCNRGTRTGGATLVVVPDTVWQAKAVNGCALTIVPVSSCGSEEADATPNVSSESLHMRPNATH